MTGEEALLGVRRRLSALRRVARTVALRRSGGSDLGRWGRDESLHESWNERTALLARWVPDGTRVLEFGAGRRALAGALPPRCTYRSSDLVDRGAGTLVIDLNAPRLPFLPPHDIAVFSGVLEYVHDLDRLVGWLARNRGIVLASYAPVTPADWPLVTRRRHGWVNDFTADELERLFGAHGFACHERSSWRDQQLFCFRHGEGGDSERWAGRNGTFRIGRAGA